MSKFADIVGHEQIIGHLQNAISMKKVSHAYILDGEDGMGKNLIASAFAQALQCTHDAQGDAGDNTVEPCGVCNACRQAESYNHPDIIRVTHEKPNTISVGDIRSLCGDIQIRPYSGAYKIYIVDEAEKMNVQAQNALLKTIEEPPSYGVIILLTNNSEAFLPTILSRCVTLKLKPLTDMQVKRFLMEKRQIPSYQAEICSAFARGNLGKACKLAVSESFSQIKDQALYLVKNVRNLEIYELIDNVKGIAEYKLEIQDYLDLMMVWYRDVLLFKATRQADALVFSAEVHDISFCASTVSYEGLENILAALEKAKVRLAANVNFDLTLELLFLTIKEA